MGKDTFDLSEMFIVRNAYADKIAKYVRFHGNLKFAGGGGFSDVFIVVKSCVLPAHYLSLLLLLT